MRHFKDITANSTLTMIYIILWRKVKGFIYGVAIFTERILRQRRN